MAELLNSLDRDVVLGMAQAAAAIGLCFGVVMLCRRFGVHVERETVISLARGLVQMVAVGEQTGALDTMLSKIADFYEDEVDTAVAGLMKLLEPVLIAFLGVAIGGIVIAMYMPMFTLIGQIG